MGYQGLGILIHKRCVIGRNCRISPHASFVGTSGLYGVPVLGDRVDVGVGAIVVGPVHIGNDVIIGAGAVVLIDLPDHCVAVGVPARIIKYNKPNQEAKE